MNARLTGRCHCGMIEVVLRATRPASELPLRQCTCTFCTRLQPLYSSDPGGTLTITARQPDAIHRYRFGTRTADFLLCRECGGYMGAVCEHDGQSLAVFNVRNFDDVAGFVQPPRKLSFDDETPAERVARRRDAWTPVSIGE